VKKIALLFVCLLCLALAPGGALAANETDWGTNSITADGIGVPPAAVATPAQAKALARRAAIMDAYRNLADYVQGVQIDAETTMRDAIIESDVVKSKVSGVVKGAVVVEEHANNDGSYSVTVKMPIFGSGNSLASAVFQEDKKQPPVPFPQPMAAPPSAPPAGVMVSAAAPGLQQYSGVVVDCRGLGLLPVMSPVIYDSNKRPIYGHENLDTGKVISLGMADYESDINNHRRAGDNPLIIKAHSLEGHSANPILSPTDADYMLYENNKSHFLENLAVVFVV
jgi:hypothetical protein